MHYIQARLHPTSTLATGDGFTGRVGKGTMRTALRLAPEKVRFAPIPGDFQNRTMPFTVADVPGHGIEVRYNGDRDVLVVEVSHDGQVVVR